MPARAKMQLETSAEEITAILEEEIALGHLGPRERLVEEELAERFQVKRHVIRQALVALDAMGIVVRQPNRGAAVKDFSIDEIDQLYMVRTLVEACAAELMPIPVSLAVITELRAIHKRHCQAADRGDLRKVFRENLKFHDTLYSACGNIHLVEVIKQLAFKTHAIRSYSIGNPDILAIVREEHGRMIRLLESGNRAEFVALIKAHLAPAKNAYLQLSRHKDRTFHR